MTLETDKAFTGAIPLLYDQHLGPLLFAPFAADLAARVARLKPSDVLETAAGTGIATRALRDMLPSETRIVATDLNQPMIDHAAARMAGRNIEWRQADATRLPFEDGSFDAVVCQFGAMFFPDKRQGYREAWRVLRPGGTYIVSIWDRIEANEAAYAVSRAVAALFPDNPPRFLERTPYGHHDIRVIREELGGAGFDAIEIDTLELRGRAPSHRAPAIGLCLGSPLRNEIEARDSSKLSLAVDRAGDALAASFGEGPIDTRIQAHICAARRG
jgi:SAM-dependent methyltransferase